MYKKMLYSKSALILLALLGMSLTFTTCLADEAAVATEDENYPDDMDTNYDEEESDIPSNIQPVISSKTQVVEVLPGGEIRLFCQGENLQHFALLWRKGKQYLIAGDNVLTHDRRFKHDEKDSALVITDVKIEDAGEYVCSVDSTTHQTVSVKHIVHVKYQPRVSVSEALRVVRQGEEVVLACNVSGYPEPQVTWTRKLHRRMSNGDLEVKGPVINFDKVSRKDAGQYECQAVNSLGTALTAVTLEVLYSPEIELPKDSVSSGKGLEAQLECIVHAEPKATVSWYRDGRIITESSKFEPIKKATHHHVLLIKNVQESDFSLYNCVANNTFGRANQSILLSGAPSQPLFKNGTHAKEDMMYTLVWTLESTLPIEEFEMKFRKNNEGWKVLPVKGHQVSEHVYRVEHVFNPENGLESNSQYEVILKAKNSYGWSRESRMHNFAINGKEYQSLEGNTEGAGVKASSSTQCLPSFLMIAVSSILLTPRRLQ